MSQVLLWLLVRPSSDPDDNACAACISTVLMVYLQLPLPADNIRIPIEDTIGHYRTPTRRVTLCSAIRCARLRRKVTAIRRLERQRRGEVPSLAHGFVDITSNYYTGYHTTGKRAGQKRFSSSTNDRLDNAKRLRKSEVTSVSNVDVDDDMQDSEGFADVVDSDEEASPPNNLSQDIHEKVEIFLNLDYAATKLPRYNDWEFWDLPECHASYCDLNFDHEQVWPLTWHSTAVTWFVVFLICGIPIGSFHTQVMRMLHRWPNGKSKFGAIFCAD